MVNYSILLSKKYMITEELRQEAVYCSRQSASMTSAVTEMKTEAG